MTGARCFVATALLEEYRARERSRNRMTGRGKVAGGWARDGAVQDQIDASVEDAVAYAEPLAAR